MEYNSTDCKAQHCGIIIDPPSFCLIYKCDDKLRKKVMPLRHFQTTSNAQFVAHDIHRKYNLEGVPILKIEKMLKILLEIMKGASKDEAVKKIDAEYEVKSSKSLGKLSAEELKTQAQIMDNLFLNNQLQKETLDEKPDTFLMQNKSSVDKKDEDFWN